MPVRWESARGCHGVSLRSAPAGRSARSPSRGSCTGSVPEATIRRRAACSRPCPSGWPSGRRWTGVRCWGLGRRVATNYSWGSRLTWGGRSRRPTTVLLNARSGVSVSWRNDSLSAELSMIARFLCAAGAALALAPAVPAQQQTSAAAQPPVINEWPVPWERTRPRDPFVASDGRVVFDSRGDIWFSAQSGNVVGKLTVASGDIRLARVPTPNARPYGIVVDKSDRPWIALFGTNKIATVDPRTFELREYALPRVGARPRRIALTSDGAV